MSPQLQLMLQQAIKSFHEGNFNGADLILKRVLQVDSRNLPALHILGLIKASQAKYKEAADLLIKAARINPNDASILYNLAKALADSGANAESILYHKKAVALAPNNPEAWLNYGKTESSLGRHSEALCCYDKAINLNPQYAEAYLNKGASLKELKYYEEALLLADKALAINANLAEAWSNKAVALKDLKRYEEAIAHYEKAMELKPDHAEAWSNKGVALHELNRHEEAIAHYERAMELKPNYAEAWFNKGAALNKLKRFNEAIVYYEKGLNLKPDLDWGYGDYLFLKLRMCFWKDVQDATDKLADYVSPSKKIIQPFSILALTDNVLLQQISSTSHIQQKFPFNPSLGLIPKYPKREKIRIGYLSADFHNHATGFLMAELFELHDKNQFELIAFSFGPKESDETRQRLQKSFDSFIEVGHQSDIEIAQLSRSLNIDIAVDLKGFTQDSRTGIFSFRAAPIQVNYLGYPGTMGADYIDYIIADKTLIPSESQQYYSEKVVYLPNSYQPNDRKRIISDKKFTRAELGLPDKGFVFCCFNNNFKILPTTFESWMRILKAVEGSVLWLFEDNNWVGTNLQKEAEKHGVDPKRLVFAERMALPNHLARHHHADLFLDTFPYNAHTTTSDALWAGLPVLTLRGRSFASRVAASLLNAVDLPGLITTDQAEYEALAIELASDFQKLNGLKDHLNQNRLGSALFDTPLYTHALESAYLKMYERYQSDLKVDHLVID